LIIGETGAGKELVARYAHECSPRHERTLRAVNCAAIPSSLVESTLFGHEKGAFTGASRRVKGVFEEADGSTVFLDEIGELALPAQAALLRVLETKRITRVGSTSELALDVRVIAATHRDLEAMVAAGTFRDDLRHRLDVIELRVPPLRERPGDLEPLVLHFLEQCRRAWDQDAQELAPEVWQALCTYSWPGNVRELRNSIEHATMACEGPIITLADLPERVRAHVAGPASDRAPSGEPGRVSVTGAEAFAKRVRAYEIELIREALAFTGGNQTQAAARLEMPLRTLVHKIRAYGLRKDE
jgi:transcriptional regulator with PAS, ATPase and Fis domain